MSNLINKIKEYFHQNIATVLVALGGATGAAAIAAGVWEWVDGPLTLATFAAAVAAWWQTRRARQRVYAALGEGDYVVALQVGRPVSEAVKKQFKRLDELVDVAAVLGGETTLSLPVHYEQTARAVYRAVCAGQGRNIHLVLSGPVALSLLIGQLIGLFHFQITVYQFAPSSGTYEPIPHPTRDWLEHGK
jgi:hypothetical protein